jgi:hypothetical protein
MFNHLSRRHQNRVCQIGGSSGVEDCPAVRKRSQAWGIADNLLAFDLGAKHQSLGEQHPDPAIA